MFLSRRQREVAPVGVEDDCLVVYVVGDGA